MHDVRILLLGHCAHGDLLLVVGSAAKGGVCAELLLVKSCHLLMLVEIISFGYLILIMKSRLWLARLLSILLVWWSLSWILTYTIVNCHTRFLALEALLLGSWLLICLGNHLLSVRLLVD
jgi:hypothetical protein